MTQPKVVQLQPDRRNAATVPPIVDGVRQQARKQLVALLKDLLNCTDDALFEMADRSHNDADHHLYFDSMRQIRLHREDIQNRFAAEISGGFDTAYRPTGDGSGGSLDERSADDISLVHNDELEVSVAISGIVSKITSQFSLPIMELTKRFDHLARQATVNERRNPLGPQMVSEAFARAIECLEVDIRIRIILLKLFERTVMQRMAPVYDDANRILADAGVLKDLRRSLGRGRNSHPHGSRSARAGAPSPGTSPQSTGHGAPAGYGGGYGDGGTGDFDAIQTLMAGMRGHPGQPTGPSGDGSGSVIATAQLLSLLSSVQAESDARYSGLEEVPTLVDLRNLVVGRARDVTGEAMNQLGRADEDVVNFIGMLFDYILNDRNLAIPMKALIARLQIPIVKLAILDKSFFERSAHPARQLLNELSSAGIGWSTAAELKRDAVYDKIESIVVRVLNDFGDSADVFEELLDELRQFRTRDTARNARMEKRVKETEAGKARTQAAREEVQKVINRKACGMRLPREVGRFLSDVWSRALVYSSLRAGMGSTDWESLMATLDDLLWSLQPLDDLTQIDQRDDLRDDLLDRVLAGMVASGLPDTDQERWRRTIAEHIDDISQNDRAFLEDDGGPRRSEDFQEMEEIVLTPPRAVDEDFAGDPPAPDFVAEINRLSEGCWVEIRNEDHQALRCKLATIVKPGERYVFVNRRGMKVAERSRMQLARDLQDDNLVVLNDSQVFDRALQAVIGNLRQIQGQGTTA